MHHSEVIARAAHNVGTGRVSMLHDPLWTAALDLEPEGGEELTPVVAEAARLVAARLSAARGAEVDPARWSDALAGLDSFEIAGILGAVAMSSKPKELES